MNVARKWKQAQSLCQNFLIDISVGIYISEIAGV